VTVRRISSPVVPCPRWGILTGHRRQRLPEHIRDDPDRPATGDVVGADISGQTNQVMQNLQQLLKAESLDFSDVVKATVHTYRTSGATSLLSTMRTSRPSLTGSRSVRP
jgi:Endoribonuclease L-PSP